MGRLAGAALLLALALACVGVDGSGLHVGASFNNIALNGTCSQSTFADWHNCSAIINGRTNDGAWSVAEREPWMTIDLKGLFFIDHIVVWNKETAAADLQDFYLTVSNSTDVETPEADLRSGDTQSAWTQYVDEGFDRSVTLNVQRTGRYVSVARFLGDEPGTLTVGEVEVFGFEVHQNRTGCLAADTNGEACSAHGTCGVDGVCACDFGFAGSQCEGTYLVQLTAATASAALVMGLCMCGMMAHQRVFPSRVPYSAVDDCKLEEGGSGSGCWAGAGASAPRQGKDVELKEMDPLLLADGQPNDQPDAWEPEEPCSLALFFASPLAHVDQQSQLVPVDPLDVEAEWRLLRDSLEKAGRRDVRISVQVATVDTFRTLVTLGGFSCIHFSGHCHPDFIAFEDGAGGAHLVSSDQLRELFRAGEGAAGIQFVFINSCYSLRVAQQFADAGVPHVIASRLDRPVSDEAAATFTRAFYLAVAVGKTIENAFAIASQAVSSAPGLPPGAGEDFVLLGAAEDHAVQLWPQGPGHSRVGLRGLPPQRLVADELPVLSEDFVGRSVDVFKIVKILSRRQLVSICGTSPSDKGIGKSSVAVAVARHMSLRRGFRHGVFFVSLKREARPTVDILRAALLAAVRSRLSVVTTGLNAEQSWRRLLTRFKTVQCVLVLDHCDDLVRLGAGEALCELLGQLLEASSTVKLVLTSQTPLSGQALLFTAKAINYRLGGLSPADAARLFVRRSSHTLRLPQEAATTRAAGAQRNPVLSFLVEHPALKGLNGHPIRIVEAASRADQVVPELCL